MARTSNKQRRFVCPMCGHERDAREASICNECKSGDPVGVRMMKRGEITFSTWVEEAVEEVMKGLRETEGAA